MLKMILDLLIDRKSLNFICQSLKLQKTTNFKPRLEVIPCNITGIIDVRDWMGSETKKIASYDK